MWWEHDISLAPRGRTIQVQRLVKDKNSASGESLRTFEEQRREYILAVQPDHTVVMTCWIPAKYTQSGNLLEGNRWSGFNVGSDPIAWAPWPTYEPADIIRSKAMDELIASSADEIFPLEDCGSGA